MRRSRTGGRCTCGATARDARRFGGELVGPDGGPLPHHDILATTAVRNLELIHPGAMQVEDFAIPVEGDPYPLEVTVELHYQRANPEFTAYVWGPDAPPMPTTVLARRVCTIAGPTDSCD